MHVLALNPEKGVMTAAVGLVHHLSCMHGSQLPPHAHLAALLQLHILMTIASTTMPGYVLKCRLQPHATWWAQLLMREVVFIFGRRLVMVV
jgi:hypothetical protein